MKIDIVKSKIYNWNALQDQIKTWRLEGKKIVFTNGCFDILHRGHVEYLSKAADLGDILIVGINSDNSPYWIAKGPSRPINNQNSRAIVLSSLFFVDAVVHFIEETPLELIKMIIPDVLTKGKDYIEENIVGYDIVKHNGGEILTIELTEGFSTTNIIEKLNQL